MRDVADRAVALQLQFVAPSFEAVVQLVEVVLGLLDVGRRAPGTFSPSLAAVRRSSASCRFWPVDQLVRG